MDKATLQKRISDKEIAIEKLVKKFDKYSKLVSEEFLALVNQFLRTGDRTAIREYTVRTNPTFRWLDGADEDLYRTASELYDARITLEKYLKQLKAEENKNATLDSMPEVLIQFRDNLIERWDRFDAWKKEQIKKEYRDNSIEYHQRCYNIRTKWGSDWYSFMDLTQDQIHKANVNAADALILNMINRTIEICGTITNCEELYLDQDNQGYLIINGIVIGENGRCRIESIGAGGYNIQRYHIRVLVKPVK